ncbi:MAG: hypothetical protein N2319_11045 [Candidatus Kapabacteria bacterium]|nr:hypothetical protein [Candidatus Kapabacteria bacterium]
MKKTLYILFIIFTFAILQSCINPFAPTLDDSNNTSDIIGDQKTVEGLFKNFRYAYVFKDTLVYGNLLADDFTFVYWNYDQGTNRTWGREEDMRSTAGLFQAAQNLDLIWNEVVLSIGDSLIKDISRGFILNIVFSPSDVVRLQGRVNLRIKRNSVDDEWKISIWRDESNY